MQVKITYIQSSLVITRSLGAIHGGPRYNEARLYISYLNLHLFW